MKTNKRNSEFVRRALSAALGPMALAALTLQGCDSQPAAAPPSDTKAKLSAQDQAAAGGRPAPQRLQAGKPPVAPTARSAPGTAMTAAPKGEAKADAAGDPTAGLMNPGDEVDGNVGSDRVPGRARARAEVPAPGAERPAATAPRNAPGATTASASDERPTWSVLLASFSGEDHRANAAGARDQIVRRYPMLKGAFVRTTSRGSVVLYGRFEGTRDKDPNAKAALELVQGIQQDGQRVFGRAMLTRVGAAPDNAPPGPHDLRTVRLQAPRGVIYSLQVAAWIGSDMKEQAMPMREVKRAAEAYCAELRAQGFDAYYFHDYDTLISIVTVGVFGKDAYDSRSTLYSPEVEAVARKFPKSLVNGEEVLIPVDPKNPKGKTYPQAPRLVEVPKA